MKQFVRRHGIFVWWLTSALCCFVIVWVGGAITHVRPFNELGYQIGWSLAFPSVMIPALLFLFKVGKREDTEQRDRPPRVDDRNR